MAIITKSKIWSLGNWLVAFILRSLLDKYSLTCLSSIGDILSLILLTLLLSKSKQTTSFFEARRTALAVPTYPNPTTNIFNNSKLVDIDQVTIGFL